MKKFLLHRVSSEYKDLAKFAEDTDSHLSGEELEYTLKKAKERHYSLQALKPKTNLPHALTKQKFYKTSKNNRPTKRTMAGHKDTPTPVQLTNMGGIKGTGDQETLCW